MATKRDEQAADYRAEAIARPFVEAAAKLAPHANADGEANHAAQAASGGGEAQGVSAGTLSALAGDSGRGSRFGSEEPVAWMCEWTDHTELYGSEAQAKRAANGDIVPQPLYRQPPQPRGWLSGDERLALDAARTIIDGSGRTNIGATIDAILARSSPPEVVKPGPWEAVQPFPGYPSWQPFMDQVTANRDKEWIAAIAAAGGAVKEVQ